MNHDPSTIPYHVHDLNPILVHIAGPLAIRWYGLAYLMGFVAGWWLLRRLSRQRLFALPEGEIGNFILAVGLWGVLVGGRVGNAIFYDLKNTIENPLSLFKLWEGGMASHGGFIGVVLVVLWYGRKHRVSVWNLGDNLTCVAPVGLLFGRIANFINGELWGRVTNVSWAMIFPTEAGYPAGEKLSAETVRQLLQNGQVHPRHPSQIYEAFGEGLALFAALWILRHTKLGQRPGIGSAAFLILYATIRIVCEFFRDPDGPLYFGWMSKGQLLSLGLYAIALLLLLLAPPGKRDAEMRRQGRDHGSDPARDRLAEPQ